jgi:small subunit ribosomal protein S12
MTTLRQSLRNKIKRIRKYHRSKTPVLKKSPQRRGICLKILKEKPKKPNSAKRSVVKLKLTTGRNIRAQIPGETHNLQRFKRVLVRGGRARDLPGIRCRVIRGKLDCLPVIKRRQARSKYGMKNIDDVVYSKKS